MKTDQNKAVMRMFLEKLDKDISAIDEFFVPDCIAHLPGFPLPTNREGFRQFVAMLYAAFPDLHHTMEDQIAENDKVANHVNVCGTHRGDFQGIPPTGKRVEFKDFFITQIQEGKVVKLWAQFDALSLLQQIGAFQLQVQNKS